MNYVFSTMSQDNNYNHYVEGGEPGSKVKIGSVLIKGGSNVMDYTDRKARFHTPLGVITEVSDEQLCFLKTNKVFLRQEKAGFLTVSKKEADMPKALKGMKLKDKSSQKSTEDYKDVSKNENGSPVINLPEIDKPAA